MTADCWADPLTRFERSELAVKLAHACKGFYAAARVARRTPGRDEFVAFMSASADMSDLHTDVTERAA
jgi:hypothetical protein